MNMETVPSDLEHTPTVTSWLCRDDVYRERTLDMEEGARPVSRITLAILAVAIAASLVVAVAVGVDARAVVHSPELAIASLALILCVAVLSRALMRSDIRHHSDAVVDQLTGMLNREALRVRVQELTQQSALIGEPIGLIIGDLDHFNEINDTHGHSVGDTVLKEVAYMVRKQLRAYDLAYRLGGEEFLVLLPGSDLANAAWLAERLRARVGCERVAGEISVTISFGVGASVTGECFDYAAVFAQADAALYRAKRNGRDRVCLAEPADVALPAPARGASGLDHAADPVLRVHQLESTSIP